VAEELIAPELEHGVLRQGWGWDPYQDLRVIRTALEQTGGDDLDDEQWKAWSHNRRLLPTEDDAIQANDLLVLPNTPRVGSWSIAEAGDDYDFAVAHTGDHGHRRRVRLLRSEINPGTIELPAGLRRTMRCQRATWNIDQYAPTIANLAIGHAEPRRSLDESFADVLRTADRAAWQSIKERFGGAEFEKPVALVLQRAFDTVEHRGGPAENGADFVCRFVGPLGIEFSVGVQLKMWSGVADDPTPLLQLRQAAESMPLSAVVALTTAKTTSVDFDRAVVALADDIRVPVRVICRDEFVRMTVSSSAPTALKNH
jgi:hypothetical protein